jgi:hypothetical protein
LLGASFFFKRGEGERGNASRFFTTLAAQLAIKLPEVVTDIITALNADPNLPDTALKTQWEKLVLGPLSTILRTSSSNRKKVVILIDALDECDDEQDLKMILRLLPKSRGLNGVDLRVFVTSRPELPIRLGFQEMNIDAHQNIALHDVPNEIIDHDLHAFLKDEFAQIRSRRLLPPTWPTENEIEALVQIARPLFIHAATICRFVADTRLGDPRDLLNNILKYKAANRASQLSGTYLPVLRRLLANLDKSDQEQVIEKFRRTVGTIITLADPLPRSSIAHLLSVRVSELDCVLDYLHSVLRVPSDPKIPIRLLHLSFCDFLLDTRQCDTDFWIDEKLTHARTAANCIKTMSKDRGLRENICNLDSPGILRSEVESGDIDASLTSELRYACRYWTYHLQRSECSIRDDDEVYDFLRTHFLHLLEALGLLGEISESISMITTLQSLLSVRLHRYVIYFALINCNLAGPKRTMSFSS